MSRIVCFRTDRIGDVLLTLPAVAALRRARPDARIAMVVASRTRELVDGQPFVDEVFSWSHRDPVRRLLAWLRDRTFDAAVHFYPRPRAAVATWLARVPRRVGTAFRWYSFLFTDRIPVHRSRNARHEAEYNADLVVPLGVPPGPPALVAPVLPSEAKAEAARSAATAGIGRRYVVVHPGGGGSALNAAPASYGRIAAALEKRGVSVVFTGTAAERGIGEATATAAGLPATRWIAPASLAALGAVLEGAVAVVGGSTGPVHLAAAVGTPTVALYPPLKSQVPTRWRPLGARAAVLVPHEAVCPTCLGAACPLYNCMDTIDPERVAAAVLDAAR